MSAPEISVIIPTRNRAALLTGTLDALAGQTLEPARFEIVVVDNGSTDATADAVRAKMGGALDLVLVREDEPGLHAGRHRGAAAARADLLVFADDDILPDPPWLAGHLAAFADPGVVLAGGNNRPHWEHAPPDWLMRLWRRPAFGGQAIPALSVIELPGPARDLDPMLVWGCNFAIRRETLEAAGGFHPDGVPDALLARRGDGESHVSRFVADRGLGCRFEPRASVAHRVTPGRMSFGYFRDRAFRQGVSDSYTEIRALGGHVPPPTPLRDTLEPVRDLLHGVRERDPVLGRLAVLCRRAHRSGIAFHREALRADPALRDWVVRPDYWGDSR